MSEVIALMESGKRYVYFIDVTKQRKHETGVLVAPVSLVFEDVAGHFPTGSDGHEPWYWSQEVCDERNARFGFSPTEADEIVASSMRASG